MNWTNQGILILLVLVASLAVAETSTPSTTVDCNNGQSLNSTLSKLNKQAPNTVTVSGTCTEYVQVIGFENLILQGSSGATLLQPSTGAGSLFNSLLYIESSRSVTVDGFSIQADTVTVPAVGIGHGSNDIRLRHLSVQGGTFGMAVFEAADEAEVRGILENDPTVKAGLNTFEIHAMRVGAAQGFGAEAKA